MTAFHAPLLFFCRGERRFQAWMMSNQDVHERCPADGGVACSTNVVDDSKLVRQPAQL